MLLESLKVPLLSVPVITIEYYVRLQTTVLTDTDEF